MDTEDPHAFIKGLAHYIRTHERGLANALLSRQPNQKNAQSSAANTAVAQLQVTTNQAPSPSQTAPSSSYFSIPYLRSSSQVIKPAKLSLTSNQLYYLLSRFEELGVAVGPLNIRLENIHAENTGYNYVSFLDKAPRLKGRSSDRDSLHSVSSVRSVMSSMSSMFSGLGIGGSSAAKIEKRQAAALEDLKYLYSSFTKIPCLRLIADPGVRRITGYEEFPFDTAVPTHVFKNVTELEICNMDFRSFFGWDRLAEQLRSLTIRRGNLDDPIELLIHIVLDDMDKRRHRSSKPPPSPSVTWNPQSPWPRSVELSRSYSTPESPIVDARRPKRDSPDAPEVGAASSVESKQHLINIASSSPSRPQSSSRRMSTYISRPTSGAGKTRRRSSTSSTSSPPNQTPRTSSSNLLLVAGLQAHKWRFLRHLSLADNGLTFINSHSLMPLHSTLHSLDLSSNLFTEIPDSLASLVSLRALNLSNCMIESLHSLARFPLPAITVLNLRGNRIASLVGIERLLSLERLDLRDNKIADPTELARLTGTPDFQDVFVRQNPFTRTRPEYRILIFNLFRKTPGYTEDITIDAKGPTSSEWRHLIDRVPEPAAVPIIQPPLEEDVPPSPTKSGARPSLDVEGTPDRTSTSDSPRSEFVTQSHRRRKGPRRRIVDITQDESPHSSGSPTQGFYSPDPSFITAYQTPVRPSVDSVGRSATSPRLSVGRVISPSQQLRDEALARQVRNEGASGFAVSSTQYKERIEALKNDLGGEVAANGAPRAGYAVQMHRQGVATGDERLG